MNVSQPSSHVPGVQPTNEAHLHRPTRIEPNRERTEGTGDVTRSLWEILTPEEREFFEQQAGLGPLTYHPGQRTRDGLSAPTGRRIDVRG
jgi:hypothetical protein